MGRCVSFTIPGSFIVCPNAINSYDAEAKLFFIRNRTAASLVKKKSNSKRNNARIQQFQISVRMGKNLQTKKKSLNVSLKPFYQLEDKTTLPNRQMPVLAVFSFILLPC